MTLKDDLAPIYDLVHLARREAQLFYGLSHVDNEAPVSAAQRAFDALADAVSALADAVSALTRLVEGNTPPHQPDVVEDGDDDDPLAADRRDPLRLKAESYGVPPYKVETLDTAYNYRVYSRSYLTDAINAIVTQTPPVVTWRIVEDYDDGCMVAGHDSFDISLRDARAMKAQSDDQDHQPDDEQPDDAEDEDGETPAIVVYIASELEKLKRVAGEWLDGYEQLRSPDESDARDVLECLEEHQAMIGRSHYLAMSLINMRLDASHVSEVIHE